MALFGITTQYLWFGVPMIGFAIGTFLDNKETQRMVQFRDRSALYAKNVEKPSWP